MSVVEETTNLSSDSSQLPTTSTDNSQSISVTDETSTTEAESNTEKTSKNHTKSPLISTKDNGMYEQALFFCAKWEEDDSIILPFCSKEAFKEMVENFGKTLVKKNTTGISKSEFKSQLRAVIDLQNELLIYVKDKIKGEHGKENYRDRLPRYGIVYTGKVYILPTEPADRKPALRLLQAALIEHNWSDDRCSPERWNPLIEDYFRLTSNEMTATTSQSEYKGDKDMLRKNVKQVMTSVANILRSQYPHNYESVLRSWGFLRERN